MDSKFQKGPQQFRKIDSATLKKSEELGIMSIKLDTTNMTSEYVLSLALAQTWGTNAPISADMRYAFDKIELETSNGTVISANWAAFFDLMRVTEKTRAATFVAGAGGGAAATLAGLCDIHLELDGSPMDVLTYIDMGNVASAKLKLYIAADAQNAFIGGTGTPGDTSITATVEAKEYPLMRGVMPFGLCRQYIIDQGEIVVSSGGASSSEKYFDLMIGNKTRFIMLHFYDTTDTRPVLSDAILDTISFKRSGFEFFNNIAGSTIRADVACRRGFDEVGAVLLDFGDNPVSYADLRNLKTQRLNFKTKSGAPASYKITCTQVYVEGLEDLGM